MTRDISCTALIDFSGVMAADRWHWSCRAPPHYPTIAENSVGTCEPTVTFLSLHSDFHCGVARWRQCDTWSGWLLIAIMCQELIAELDQDEEGCITSSSGHRHRARWHSTHSQAALLYTGSNNWVFPPVCRLRREEVLLISRSTNDTTLTLISPSMWCWWRTQCFPPVLKTLHVSLVLLSVSH